MIMTLIRPCNKNKIPTYYVNMEHLMIPHSVGKCHAVTKGLGTCQVRRSLQEEKRKDGQRSPLQWVYYVCLVYWRTAKGRPYNGISAFVRLSDRMNSVGCRGCQSLQIQSTAHCSLLMALRGEQSENILRGV